MSKILYTDEELTRWWTGLAESERQEIFERIEKYYEERHSTTPNFVETIRNEWATKKRLHARQISTLRRWE